MARLNFCIIILFVALYDKANAGPCDFNSSQGNVNKYLEGFSILAGNTIQVHDRGQMRLAIRKSRLVAVTSSKNIDAKFCVYRKDTAVKTKFDFIFKPMQNLSQVIAVNGKTALTLKEFSSSLNKKHYTFKGGWVNDTYKSQNMYRFTTYTARKDLMMTENNTLALGSGSFTLCKRLFTIKN